MNYKFTCLKIHFFKDCITHMQPLKLFVHFWKWPKKTLPLSKQADQPKHNHLKSTQSRHFRCSTWILLLVPENADQRQSKKIHSCCHQSAI